MPIIRSGYTQFHVHEGGFIVFLPAALVDHASKIGLTMLITLCVSVLVLNILALKGSSEIDSRHYVRDELSFLRYAFKTGTVSYIVVTLAAKRPNVLGSVELDVPGREVVGLKVASCSSNDSCKLQWKRVNGEVEEEEVLGGDGGPDTYYLELLLQRDTGWTQESSVVDHLLMAAWGSLKSEWTRAQITIPTTIKKVF